MKHDEYSFYHRRTAEEAAEFGEPWPVPYDLPVVIIPTDYLEKKEVYLDDPNIRWWPSGGEGTPFWGRAWDRVCGLGKSSREPSLILSCSNGVPPDVPDSDVDSESCYSQEWDDKGQQILPPPPPPPVIVTCPTHKRSKRQRVRKFFHHVYHVTRCFAYRYGPAACFH